MIVVFIHSTLHTLDQISQSLNKVSQSLRPHQSCPLHRVYFSLSYRGTQVHSRTGVAITYSWPQYARARTLITRAPAAQWLSSRLTRAVMGHMIIEECLTRPRDISEFLSLHERRQEVLLTVHSTSTSTTPSGAAVRPAYFCNLELEIRANCSPLYFTVISCTYTTRSLQCYSDTISSLSTQYQIYSQPDLAGFAMRQD